MHFPKKKEKRETEQSCSLPWAPDYNRVWERYYAGSLTLSHMIRGIRPMNRKLVRGLAVPVKVLQKFAHDFFSILELVNGPDEFTTGNQ